MLWGRFFLVFLKRLCKTKKKAAKILTAFKLLWTYM